MQMLLTGHTHGLGRALGEAALARGATVYGLARGRLEPAPTGLVQAQADFAAPAALAACLDALVPTTAALDVVILNAGVLGPIAAMVDTPLDELRQVMDVNVWANKVILDWLVGRAAVPGQVVLMSSGASQSGHFGWGAYALSKAALNMLARLYAHELPHSHLVALAPGLVATAMQDELARHDAATFPSLARLHAARGTADMPTPAVAAAHLLDLLPALQRFPSGEFVDVRRAFPAVPAPPS
ncbi:MAG: SDR family NAD(P)-dependent oxidoreductase [Gammaproteobacteria bacterium]